MRRHVSGFSMTTVLVGTIAIVSAPASIRALDANLARTPPMGWSTFNQWGGGWTETPVNGQVVPFVKLVADSLISTGLRDCGYIYLNVDGANGGQAPFWPGYSGFTGWAKPTADHLHARGLKFGVYTSEFSNPQGIASDLAAAGVEFIKVDAWTTAQNVPGWKTLADALEATGKPVFYSTHSSLPGVSHLWRTGGDIQPFWPNIMSNYDANYAGMNNSGPGTWADPDMLEVGCRAFRKTIDLTYDESRSHFTMWCMMAAPLIIGFDVTRTHVFNAPELPEYVKTIAIFANTEAIAVDQDSLGKPGKRIKGQGSLEVWTKELKDGTKAVAFFNRTGAAASMSITQADLGWGSASQIHVRDLWAHQDLQNFSGTFTKSVATHAAEIYRMSTSTIVLPSNDLRKMDRSIAWLAQHGYDLFPRKLLPGVLAGMHRATCVFDLRGRAIAIVNPARTAPGFMVIKSKQTDLVEPIVDP